MRVKSITIYCLLCIGIISFIVFAIPYGCSCRTNDLCIGITASSIVALVVAIIEYDDCRKKSMREFCETANDVVKIIRKLKYIELDVPSELLINCIVEEESNLYNKPRESHESKHALQDYIESYKNIIQSPEDDRDRILEDAYAWEYKESINLIKKHAAIYCEMHELDLSKLDSTFHSLYFICHQRRVKEIAKDIHDKLSAFRDEIDENALLFKDANKNRNLAKCLEIMLRHNDLVFDIVSGEAYEWLDTKTVYNKFADSMEQTIENFRSKIEFGDKARAVNPKPMNIKYTAKKWE